MNENAKKWVKALRSGKYKQTTYRLRNDKGFCCLGVACDLYDPKKWKYYQPKKGRSLTSGDFFYGSSIAALPTEVRDWLGLADIYGYYNTQRSLDYLNDNLEWDFKKIADFIEDNWDRLSS